MKKILIAGVLAVVAASPALAASKHARNTTDTATQSYAVADASYAYVPVASRLAVSNGEVLGADPDAFIRQSLIRASSPANYNN